MTVWGAGRSAARVWGVGAIVQAVGDSLQARFGQCVIQGEISGFVRAASGHAYFTLKDEHGAASLRCAMFRRALQQVEFRPADGLVVQARGNLTVYEARGELQLVVEGLQPAGAGALYEQFLRLRARLADEGLFDEGRKRAIPAHPRRLGLVTSAAGAALHDVVTALRRRAPHVEVILAPASVQGAESAPQLVAALAALQARHSQSPLDAILLCRGGGSLEDLWSFNDERVVRAVAACRVPVICGVGHETDVTLADLAADLRAPTPTAAAELAAAPRADSLAELGALSRGLSRAAQHHLWREAQRVDRLGLKLAKPAAVLSNQRQSLAWLQHRLGGAMTQAVTQPGSRLDAVEQRLARAMAGCVGRAGHQLAVLGHRLDGLDPSRVLKRGYAWLQDEQGVPLIRSADARAGQSVSAVMQDGVLSLTVSGGEPKPRASRRRAPKATPPSDA